MNNFFYNSNKAAGSKVYINTLQLEDIGDSNAVIRTVKSFKSHEAYDNVKLVMR